MKLIYLVPVYNEKETVKVIIERLAALPVEKEIIVVDDGSTDGSREILRSLKGIKYIEHVKNAGKGAAVITGIKDIEQGIVIIQDADLELAPEETVELSRKIKDARKDVVYGTRIKNHRYFLTGPLICNKLLFVFTNMLFGSRLTDVMTCYKIMDIAILRALDLQSKGFDIETEITAKLLASGYNIIELPISYRSRDIDAGKKIRYRDSFKIIGALVKYWALSVFKKHTWAVRER